MPIILEQYRLRELGRIRMGAKGDRGQPTKLKTWRLTSASRELLEAVAETYGGEVQVWKDAPNDGEHFEIVTATDTLNILVPPGDAAFSQWMEMWSGGGCKRRCDGRNQVLRDVPCACPKDPDERRQLASQGKACKETTRFNVMLPDIPDVGVWRLETHGYYAAVELAGFQQLVQVATAQGSMIRARLRIDHRTAKKGGEGDRPQTFRYTVPVVEISHSVADMLQVMGADPTDVMVSLPGPIEHKSLPGARAALPEQAAGWDSGTEGGPTDGTPVAAEGTTASPSDPSDWMTDLRSRFSDDLIIAAGEQVRFETYGEGTPITTIAGVLSAEKVGLHTTIVERLTKQGPKGGGAVGAEASAKADSPPDVGTGSAASEREPSPEPQSGGRSNAEPTAEEETSDDPAAPSLDLGGGGDSQPAAAELPASSEENGHARERLVALIDHAVTAEIRVGSGPLKEAFVCRRYDTVAGKKDLPKSESYQDVLDNGEEVVLAELCKAWSLEDKIGELV